jgi:hypothetical protein
MKQKQNPKNQLVQLLLGSRASYQSDAPEVRQEGLSFGSGQTDFQSAPIQT